MEFEVEPLTELEQQLGVYVPRPSTSNDGHFEKNSDEVEKSSEDGEAEETSDHDDAEKPDDETDEEKYKEEWILVVKAW